MEELGRQLLSKGISLVNLRKNTNPLLVWRFIH
uniref:Ran protein/TC4 protein n=1 Tax=Capsicum annuum TaxID=4072 RepID=Q6RVZ3_CAPAN|nr:Ran protein/TC4 protein [Capsicum annuum]